MSLSPHQRGNISNLVKPNTESLEETQHSEEAFYNVGTSSLEQTLSSSGGKLDPNVDLQGSTGFKPEKGYQAWGHFQQPGPVKWVHQDPVHTTAWFPGMANPTKVTQSFGVDDTRGHQALHKANHDMDPLQQENPSQSLAPGMEWNHHNMAAMQHAQFQALQQGHKPGDPQYQRHAMRHAMPDSTLQSFQLAFGPTKQAPASGFYPAFHGNSASQNLGYTEQTKSQQQQLFQLQQLQQHQQQIQLQQMHQLQHQQQQQQQMHIMQQQYQQQQKMQEQMQHMQKQQQLQSLQQPFVTSPHQQDQRLTRPQQPDDRQLKAHSSPSSQQRQPTAVKPQTQDPTPESPVDQEHSPSQPSQEQQETQTKPEVFPRRSRRLSRDGISPVSSQPSKEPARNGGVGGHQGPSVGVIQSTQRRRRTSKEINLETLAQKASEMEFLPAKRVEIGSGRQGGMHPLIIPVSVPVRRVQIPIDLARSWGHEQRPLHQVQPDRKPSVIVARRRSLRNSTSDSFNQDEEREDGSCSDKVKRRPRPEPLVIPPPRPTFIAPSVYSSITSYQSHLRSPVRTLDHPLVYPPYTPPPILSPVREGSGLYFSTFLSSMAAGSQGVALPPTPKTANRSLLHSSSSDISPPVLPLGEATPVSLEPRINIGSQYQAEIPELQDPSLIQQDEHKAILVWHPFPADKSTQEEAVENLTSMACSSVLCGGGTNVELMHHCLHENCGDIIKTLDSLLMKNPIFSKNHHLSNYHYAGSDYWTVDEKHYFNKGISAYRKDFFLVQKLVRSKTVSQCVEFYYTYKKQLKVGRNGTFMYGPPEVNEWSSETVQKQEQPVAEEVKLKGEQENVGRSHLETVTQTLQVSEIEGKPSVVSKPNIGFADNVPVLKRETQTPPLSVAKPRPEGTGKKSKPPTTSKSQGEPEGIFPCKKCGRVFYKVKSRSAHMKSHAEQEKKAAAQRQREEEERAAARARQEAARRRAEEESSGEEESMAEPEDERDEDWR